MRRVILVVVVLLTIGISLVSCSRGVSQEKYDEAASELADAQALIQALRTDNTTAQALVHTLRTDNASAQAQVRTLQSDKTAAQTLIQALQTDNATAQALVQTLQSDNAALTEKCADALAYAEFVDVLLYPSWVNAGLDTRFEFASEVEWIVELHNRADAIGDSTLETYLAEIEEGGTTGEAAVPALMDYCISKIEENLG